MEARRREAEDEQGLKPLRRGWCLGIEEFRQNMLELMERKLGVGRINLRSDVLPSASPPRSALCPLSSVLRCWPPPNPSRNAHGVVNEVSASQQLARRDRHFLHAGNNPNAPTPPKRQPRLGQIYGPLLRSRMGRIISPCFPTRSSLRRECSASLSLPPSVESSS